MAADIGNGQSLTLWNAKDQRLAAHGSAITHDDARESFASGGSAAYLSFGEYVTTTVSSWNIPRYAPLIC